MIRVGIVGSNYGRTVQLPAFRADPRCEVAALADACATAAAVTGGNGHPIGNHHQARHILSFRARHGGRRFLDVHYEPAVARPRP